MMSPPNYSTLMDAYSFAGKILRKNKELDKAIRIMIRLLDTE